MQPLNRGKNYLVSKCNIDSISIIFFVLNNVFILFSIKTYGYEHILTLNNLEKAGLLKLQSNSRNNYPTIRKTLKLWMEDANEQVQDLLNEETTIHDLTHQSLRMILTSDLFFFFLRTPTTSPTCTVATLH